MSGPNTINPYGTKQVNAQANGNGRILLYDKANLTDPKNAYKVTILYLQLNQLTGGGTLTLVDENNVQFWGVAKGVVPSIYRAWDFPSQVSPGANHSVYALVAGGTVVDIEIDIEAYQERVS